MNRYHVVLSPSGGGQQITAEISAGSDSEARQKAEAQYSGYKVVSIRMIF